MGPTRRASRSILRAAGCTGRIQGTRRSIHAWQMAPVTPESRRARLDTERMTGRLGLRSMRRLRRSSGAPWGKAHCAVPICMAMGSVRCPLVRASGPLPAHGASPRTCGRTAARGCRAAASRRAGVHARWARVRPRRPAQSVPSFGRAGAGSAAASSAQPTCVTLCAGSSIHAASPSTGRGDASSGRTCGQARCNAPTSTAPASATSPPASPPPLASPSGPPASFGRTACREPSTRAASARVL
mmetsp:Transcript_6623/g.19986  ORF Transcript_6623/g.19986 Transcript_6623/m.19986 type:complete len:243 (-) Transcript_6623:792-1520(-)